MKISRRHGFQGFSIHFSGVFAVGRHINAVLLQHLGQPGDVAVADKGVRVQTQPCQLGEIGKGPRWDVFDIVVVKKAADGANTVNRFYESGCAVLQSLQGWHIGKCAGLEVFNVIVV